MVPSTARGAPRVKILVTAADCVAEVAEDGTGAAVAGASGGALAANVLAAAGCAAAAGANLDHSGP